MKGQDRKNNSGFTLVEMMVAIAVFSIVMVTAMSALLNVIDANNKAKSIKTAINNISFALEGISKDARMGTEYACADGGDEPNGSCTGGGDIIKYRSPRVYDEITKENKFVYYRYNNADKTIEECMDDPDIPFTCEANSAGYFPITSTEATLNDVRFYVLNDDSATPEVEQPRIIMIISGEAGTKDKVKTYFDLQTSISQRIRVDTTTP